MLTPNEITPDTDQSSSAPDIDEPYWIKAIQQRKYYRPEITFDRYRWALRYGQAARRRHGAAVTFEQVEADLQNGWSSFGGPAQLTWEEARESVRDAWEHLPTLQAEAVASHAGFEKPPTFQNNGDLVPRNLDEPNR